MAGRLTPTIYNAACDTYLQQLCKKYQIAVGPKISGVNSLLTAWRNCTAPKDTNLLPNMIEIVFWQP